LNAKKAAIINASIHFCQYVNVTLERKKLLKLKFHSKLTKKQKVKQTYATNTRRPWKNVKSYESNSHRNKSNNSMTCICIINIEM